MLHLFLKDDEYPLQEIDHTRVIARAVAINDRHEVAVLHVIRDDIFGNYDYYELPGGGVKSDEDLSLAAIREIHEEVGATCSLIQEIGIVDDFYNLLRRHNENHYFLLQVIDIGKRDLEEYEKMMIHEVIWVDIDQAIKMFQEMPSTGVSKLVKNRELPVLMECRKYIKEL